MKAIIKEYVSQAAAETVNEVFDLGDGQTMLCLDYESSDAFRGELAKAGYSAVKQFSVGSTDGTFFARENGDTVYFYTNKKLPFAHAVIGAELPFEDVPGEALYADTILHQFQTKSEDEPYPGGMTYLIRLRDGRFIVIDGGFEVRPDEFLHTMGVLHPKADKDAPYEIAAWIFTHPHDDHLTLFYRFHENREAFDKLHISRIIYNTACDAVLAKKCEGALPDARKLRELTSVLCEKGTLFFKPHTGMSFDIGELHFKVFFTQNEWTASDMIYLNDASTVFSISRDGGRSIMILGDIMEFAGAWMMNMYEPSALRCDAVQVAHHSVRGPDIEIYKAISPKLCLWTMQSVCYELYGTKMVRNMHLRELDAFHSISCFGPIQITL